MKIGVSLNYASGFKEAAREVIDFERGGLDHVFVAEAYSFDAVSALGYLAAITERMQIGSGILQSYIRTPTATAMTAAGLDSVSEGRFILGLGASGPQVVEGFHGVPYDAPVGRTREIIDICHKVWRREVLIHDGRYYQIPTPMGRGTGVGKALKLINKPVRDDIPVALAAIGPKNVALTAEIADIWLPFFFHPERASTLWADALATGASRRDSTRAPLQIYANPVLAIGEHTDALYPLIKAQLALYIGGMGAKSKNFYYNIAAGYGYQAEADRIQGLYLSGQRQEAAHAVPDELVRDISLVGPAGFVKERIDAFREAGVTGLTVTPLAFTPRERLTMIEKLRELTT